MRRHFTLFSVVAHAVVITAALAGQQLDVGALPTPRQPVLFDAADIMPADIQLPTPPRRSPPDRAASTESGSASSNAAPIVAPSAVAPESEREDVAASPGPIAGVENGASMGIESVGGGGVPPPPPPAPAGPIRLHQGMKAPYKIVDAAPVYPAVAQRARVEGVVILEVVIDARGRVGSVGVLRSIALLDQAAADAVRQWRFTPALLNGEPVPVVMTVTVNFTLQGR
jgi:periplasmic protein TonB